MWERVKGYLKQNDVKIKDGTDVTAILRDMMSVILERPLDEVYAVVFLDATFLVLSRQLTIERFFLKSVFFFAKKMLRWFYPPQHLL